VSLINDAWKEAQRQRDAQHTPGKPAMLGEDFFPEPPRANRSNRPRVIAGSIALVALSAVVVALTVHVALRAPSPPDSSTPSPASGRAVSPAANRGAGAPPGGTTAPSVREFENTRSETQTQAGGPAERPLEGSTSARATSDGRSSAVTAAADDRTPASPPPTEPRSAARSRIPATPERSGSSGVRVIIDPVALRTGDSLFARAYAEQTRGNLDGAAELYERALLNPPVSPELYNDYGALLATRGKHAAAIAMYNRGIAANGDDARIWMNLGDSYRAVGRRADAMGAYFEAARRDPSNIAARIRLAAEYAALGDTASARRGFAEAAQAAPNDPEVRYRYGAFLLEQHDTRAAIRELDRFIELAPGRYPADVVERTRTVVANLRRQTP
jgi:Tfp pilus assembly protein PilF